MARQWVWPILLVVAIALLASRQPHDLPAQASPACSLRCIRGADGAVLFHIERNGKTLYTSTVGPYFCRMYDYPAHTQMGQDVVGDGRGYLCVYGDAGGTYPYGEDYVFEVSPSFRLVASDLHVSKPGWFEDLEGDGRVEMICTDQVGLAGHFAYKHYPPLIYRITHEGFVLAPDLMARQQVPARDALLREARHLAADQNSSRGPTCYWMHIVSQVMDNLLHSGRGDLAWAYFDAAWPAHQPGKAATAAAFRRSTAANPLCARLEGLPHTPPLRTALWTLPTCP